MEAKGFEPLTPGLQSRCSSQLSYAPEVSPLCHNGRSLSRVPAESGEIIVAGKKDQASSQSTATILREISLI